MAIKERARAGKVEPFGRTGRPLSPAGDVLQQCLYLPPFPRAGVRFQLGLLASRSDCWWILFKMRPEKGSGGGGRNGVNQKPRRDLSQRAENGVSV